MLCTVQLVQALYEWAYVRPSACRFVELSHSRFSVQTQDTTPAVPTSLLLSSCEFIITLPSSLHPTALSRSLSLCVCLCLSLCVCLSLAYPPHLHAATCNYLPVSGRDDIPGRAWPAADEWSVWWLVRDVTDSAQTTVEATGPGCIALHFSIIQRALCSVGFCLVGSQVCATSKFRVGRISLTTQWSSH